MLTAEQKNALNDILQDYWQETNADDVIDDVLEIADPIETAKYLEKAANDYEANYMNDSPEEKKWSHQQAEKFRGVAKLLRKTQ